MKLLEVVVKDSKGSLKNFFTNKYLFINLVLHGTIW